MNKEVKEILDSVRKCCDITKEQSFVIYQRQDILKLLDYITNLQEENERLREERNGKQLREMHKINNYDYFKEMTNNWNREDFSRRCYDLCNEKVDLQQRIEKAVEYGNSCISKDLDLETLDEPYKTTFKTAYEIHNNYLDILNGKE